MIGAISLDTLSLVMSSPLISMWTRESSRSVGCKVTTATSYWVSNVVSESIFSFIFYGRDDDGDGKSVPLMKSKEISRKLVLTFASSSIWNATTIPAAPFLWNI